MLDPVVSTLEVPCSQKQAFDVFVNDMASWWPVDKRSISVLRGKKTRSLQVEAELGGTIVEIADDDTEYLWGTIRLFEPHGALSMDFHMGLPPDKASLVELRFTALGEKKTLVVLKQSRWEAFGELAEQMRGGYGSSWSLIFEDCYQAACLASAALN